MHLQTLACALALAGSSFAFSDSAPFVLLSTAASDKALPSERIQTGSQVQSHLEAFLKTCPTSRYLFVNQPGVSAADLRDSNDCALPSLCRAIDHQKTETKYLVPEVVGDLSKAGLEDLIFEHCNARADKAELPNAVISHLDLPSPASNDRSASLADHDFMLRNQLDDVMDTKHDSYTIIFFSNGDDLDYRPEFVDASPAELKRNVQMGTVRRQDNETDWNKLPLFEKYQFFTPGIFMALIVSVILFSILGVGLSALSSLEVSYGAFEKDMGPAAQKKQQ